MLNSIIGVFSKGGGPSSDMEKVDHHPDSEAQPKVEKKSSIASFFHLENSSLFQKTPIEKKNTTAASNLQMMENLEKSNDKSNLDGSQDDLMSQIQMKEDIEETNKAMDDIGAIILNQRKINFADDLGQPSAIREVSSQALRNNIKNQLEMRDTNDRQLLHRAAFDQQSIQLQDVLTAICELEHVKKQEIIEQKDRYGNTALLLACIRRFDEPKKQEIQKNVVQMLLEKHHGGADPMVQNPETLFTPLHWACIHGAHDIVRLLLEHGAKAYVPDKRGFFPIDYAGLFMHENIIQELIQSHLDNHSIFYKKVIKKMNNNTYKNNDAYIVELQKQWDIELEQYQHSLLLFSPVYHTSMLYWAAKSDKVPVQTIVIMMKELEAYPEGPIAMASWGTPIHSAASVGNLEKMKVLLSEVKNRYEVPRQQAQGNISSVKKQQIDPLLRYKKVNILFDFDLRWARLNKQRNYNSLKKFDIQVFQKKLTKCREEAEALQNLVTNEKFSYDFLDVNLNSPLHIASQEGHPNCIEVLLNDYNLQYDQRNIDGWMAKDIVQQENVRRVYSDQYKKFENRKREIFYEIQQKTPLGPNLNNVQSTTSKKTGQIAPFAPSSAQQLQEDLSSLSERDRLNRELMDCREFMPIVPPLVLKVNTPKSIQKNTEVVNSVIDLLINAKFQIRMIPSLDQNIFYIALSLDQSELENEAKQTEVKIKLCNFDAKRVYDPSLKQIFEPFRSKDIQRIILNRLQRTIILPQLMRQEIILSVIYMHDFFGLHEIESRWFRTSFKRSTSIVQKQSRRCCQSKLIPMPLPLISQFYNESPDIQFSEVSSIKNYFGEKVGFYFAWMTHYTAWLLIPAIGGLAITIYQGFLGDVETIFLSIYALLVCVWATIFLERWKRKSSELSLKWGVSDTQYVRTMRDQFLGYEYFSHETLSTEKKTHQPQRLILVWIIQLPIFCILIGLCIAMFFAQINLKTQKTGNVIIDKFISTIAGVINGIVIFIIDMIYSYCATYFVNLENNKYQDSYEKSYVYKLFIFKFVNTNMSLFYTAFNDKDFNSLYFLILGMAITKAVMILIMKNLKKIGIYWWKKKKYFNRVREAALSQKIQHQSFINAIQSRNNTGDGTGINIQELIDAEMKKHAIYRDLDQSQVLQRLIFNTNKNVETQQILVDQIELNDLMHEKSDIIQINEMSEVFILFGLATLYSCACPIVPLFVMIHNMIDINMDLFSTCTTTKRVIAQPATNIDPWLEIAEFMALAAVISNSLLLYFSTPTLYQWFQEQLSEHYKDVYLLWILVVVEHIIIAVKQLCAALIEDVPQWVEKSYQRIRSQEQKQEQLKQERQMQMMVSFVKERMEAQNKKKRQQIQEFNQMMRVLEQQKKEDQKTIEMLKGKYHENSEQMKKQIQNNSNNNQVAIPAQVKGEMKPASLVDFLGINPSEWYAKSRTAELDKALIRNLQRRLMFQTFSTLEREVLTKRIGKLFDTKLASNQANLNISGGLQLNCADCAQQLAIFECVDCMDHFCQQCCNEIHQNKDICINHTILQLKDSKGAKWKKFENFNFPVLANNALHQYLSEHFKLLRQKYLDRNYIESADKIHLQGLFVDRQYDLLTDQQSKALQAKDVKFQDALINQKQSFNEEELYYINKVAFYLFANKSHTLTFSQFQKTLGMLQSSQLLTRYTLWLQLLSEETRYTPGFIQQDQTEAQEIITREQLEEVFRFSFTQSTKGNTTTYKDILNIIFKQGSNTTTKSQMLELLTKNEEFREYISCILQFRPATTSISPLNALNSTTNKQ